MNPADIGISPDEAIRQVRKALSDHNMSISDAAKLSGLDRSRVSRILSATGRSRWSRALMILYARLLVERPRGARMPTRHGKGLAVALIEEELRKAPDRDRAWAEIIRAVARLHAADD